MRRPKLSPLFASEIPKPTIVTPNIGMPANFHYPLSHNFLNFSALLGPDSKTIEKFLMIYTCKQCGGRNNQLVSKVAYYEGIVISTCKTCKVNHLIADNLKKLDMGEYGSKIETYLESKGETVQRLSLTPEDLENNYLIDRDGMLTLQPKIGNFIRYLTFFNCIFSLNCIKCVIEVANLHLIQQ